MKIQSFASTLIDWDEVAREEIPGEKGTTTWQTIMMNEIRVRMVEFSPGYKADHLCHKGHVILCLDGQLDVGLPDGSNVTLNKGMSYLIGDDTAPHMASTEVGCKVFIVD